MSAFSAAKGCSNISGELTLWNGHPPSLRITLSDTDLVYGISEAGEEPTVGAIPSELYSQILKGENRIKGNFCIEKLGKFTQVPYSKNKIEYINIKSYSDINK